jgi:hypothetical protein
MVRTYIALDSHTACKPSAVLVEQSIIALTFVVNDHACFCIIDRADRLVAAIVLITISILDASTVTRASKLVFLALPY